MCHVSYVSQQAALRRDSGAGHEPRGGEDPTGGLHQEHEGHHRQIPLRNHRVGGQDPVGSSSTASSRLCQVAADWFPLPLTTSVVQSQLRDALHLQGAEGHSPREVSRHYRGRAAQGLIQALTRH